MSTVRNFALWPTSHRRLPFITHLHTMETKDSLGNVLATGDSVKLTKDLKVGGTSVTLKGGQVIKKIRVTDDPDEIDCKVDGIKIAVKTAFVRKVQ